MMKRILFSILTGLIIIAGIGLNKVMAAGPPHIKVSLALDKSAYLLTPSDPIKAVITVDNANGVDGVDIITSNGFSGEPFHLFLTFIDPDGKGITANELGSHETEGGPPKVIVVNGELIQVEGVETLANGWVLSVEIPDAHTYYTLTKGGRYSVKAIIPMRTYPPPIDYPNVSGVDYAGINSSDWSGVIESNTVDFSLVADADGDGYSYPEAVSPPYNASAPDCNDNNAAINPGVTEEIPGNGIDDDCNPATSDIVSIPPGTLVVKAEKHTVGSGSHPGTSKEPIVGLPVRVYDKAAGSCVWKFGVSWQNYKSIWLSCSPLSNGIGTTDSSGAISFTVTPGSYLMIGEYDPSAATPGDEIYIGKSEDDLQSGEVEKEHLKVIVNTTKGKILPAKYTKKTGSELLVIEPEYVEWDGTQELYPFIFESIGDWTVTTAVTPPEGFVTDHGSLTAMVNTEIESVQFTITDVGSEWVSTGVTHKLKHKGKSEIVRSQIGVKLSERLAKAKGLSRFGGKIKGGK